MWEVTISYPFRLRSHPDRLLVDHIRGVCNHALDNFDTLKLEFDHFSVSELRTVVRIMAEFHDFGKGTKFFQEYIQNPADAQVKTSLKRHGLLSAITVYQLLRKLIPDQVTLALMGFMAVRRHHGDLLDFRNLMIVESSETENITRQWEHLQVAELENIYASYGSLPSFNTEVLQEIKSHRRLDRSFDQEYYFVFNLLYSLLLQADKSDAILHESVISQAELLSASQVLSYKSTLRKESPNNVCSLRETAFASVAKQIDLLTDNNRILSINLPTGAGKTLTALYTATRLSERFGHSHILYCLPFTSIIDQNFRVLEAIFNQAGIEPASADLLKHHHLADTKYTIREDNSGGADEPQNGLDANKSLHLIEGWESRITVTTFVQFVQSLISYRNASLRKFHRLANAVIILDEVQTIPHHYWQLIRELLNQLSRSLNTRIVLVTATMPLLFSEERREIRELVAEKQKLFKAVNRITLWVNKATGENIAWYVFLEEMRHLVARNKQKHILFVMNTIHCARELYSFLQSEFPNHQLLYLSAHLLPLERLKRIDEIKNKSVDKPMLVVSTQLVEAGVDIDLDVVVRDFAPLDSIFQSCGRCNREGLSGTKGQVFLYALEDDRGFVPASVYPLFLRQKTQKILKEFIKIEESEFYNLSQKYYKELESGGSQQESHELLKRIQRLQYNDHHNRIELNLITDSYSHSVFLEVDERAKKLWTKYQEITHLAAGFEKNALVKRVRRNMSEYIINVPKRCLPDVWDGGIYYVPHEEVAAVYDPETGFVTDTKLPEKTESFII